MSAITRTQRKHFAALDWASAHHDVVVVDQQGRKTDGLLRARAPVVRPRGRGGRESFLATSLAQVLRTLEQQLRAYRARIAQRFREHPDHDLFGSLPGVGPKLGPRLAAEIGTQRDRFVSAEGLQAYAGTAPVTFKSGQIERHVVRRACAPFLRCAVHHWADHSRQPCAWAKAYYDKHRQDGDRHACARRCLGQRWLTILWRMGQDGTRYDEPLHTRAQLKHESCRPALQPNTNPFAGLKSRSTASLPRQSRLNG